MKHTRLFNHLLLLVLVVSSVSASNKLPLKTSSEELEQRVFQGEIAPANAYPWVAALLEAGSSTVFDRQFCGGSLIHPYWVLTAAHCVDDIIGNQLYIGLGESNLLSMRNEDIYSISEIIIHPEYVPFQLDYDIALIRLSRPVEGIEPIALINNSSALTAGTMAKVLGWGAINEETYTYPTLLMQGDVPLVSLTTANAPAIWDGELFNVHLAAGYLEGGTDACMGDSGGPLLLRASAESAYFLAGITSAGIGGKDCGDAGNLGVYTNVYQFLSWIEGYTGSVAERWRSAMGVSLEEWELDEDNDGLTAKEEYLFGSNPSEFSVGVEQGHHEFNKHDLLFRELRNLEDHRLTMLYDRSQDLEIWLKNPESMGYLPDFIWKSEDFKLSGGVLYESGYWAIQKEAAYGARVFFRFSMEESDVENRTSRDLKSGLRDNGVLFPETGSTRWFGLNVSGLEQVNYSLHITHGFPQMRILDSETGEFIATANTDGSDENVANIQFTPASIQLRRYWLEISVKEDLGIIPYILMSYGTLTEPAGSITRGVEQLGNLSANDNKTGYVRGKTHYVDDYKLIVPDNEYVTITLSSDTFDCLLILEEFESGMIIEYNDDVGDSTNSEIARSRFPAGSYVIRVSSYGEREIGGYRLMVTD